MDAGATGARHGDERLTQIRTDGVGERHVRHDALPEEGGWAVPRRVDELVGHGHVERSQLLAQAADGADRDNPLHPQRLEAVNVAPEVDLGRQKPVSAAVPRQEGDVPAFDRSQDVRVAGIAERRADTFLTPVLEAGHLVQATAADDSQGSHGGLREGGD